MRPFNTIRFLNENDIDYSLTHHHCTEGRANIHCPFCSGRRNYHLGLLLDVGNGNCWRCGDHDIGLIIKALLDISWGEVNVIKSKYSEAEPSGILRQKDSSQFSKPESQRLALPLGTTELTTRHRAYLEGRNFDPDRLISEWGLLGTGPFGSYKHRVIAPIYCHQKLVSYQGRDITNRSDLRYMTCSKEDELLHHKHMLYGIDKLAGLERAVVVEGVTDVWRLGAGAVATFGISWKLQQALMLLSRKVKRVYVLFDEQPQAQEQARRLALMLALDGREVEIITEAGASDPADLSQSEAEDLMARLT